MRPEIEILLEHQAWERLLLSVTLSKETPTSVLREMVEARRVALLQEVPAERAPGALCAVCGDNVQWHVDGVMPGDVWLDGLGTTACADVALVKFCWEPVGVGVFVGSNLVGANGIHVAEVRRNVRFGGTVGDDGVWFDAAILDKEGNRIRGSGYVHKTERDAQDWAVKAVLSERGQTWTQTTPMPADAPSPFAAAGVTPQHVGSAPRASVTGAGSASVSMSKFAPVAEPSDDIGAEFRTRIAEFHRFPIGFSCGVSVSFAPAGVPPRERVPAVPEPVPAELDPDPLGAELGGSEWTWEGDKESSTYRLKIPGSYWSYGVVTQVNTGTSADNDTWEGFIRFNRVIGPCTLLKALRGLKCAAARHNDDAPQEWRLLCDDEAPKQESP